MAELLVQQYNNFGFVKGPSKRKSHRGFSSKCASLVKQQRARVYILRRCATMLLCWYIQGED
ncbi:hypothetical protein SLEP1_g21131 [Rubroshorea leprosula]|uniref:Uncharacterized protein n=1 Tax=Rubroshorea leprosula TaxID=152421 RepID=A0AAV5J4Z6_9ROSI|nr:hypothetical protein SLEP1_g21131 [Rubroshorea leprosula]